MGDRTWSQLISALLRSTELSTEDTAWAMEEIMAGEATQVQIAAFAVALRAKGETPGEHAGLVQAMLARALPVELDAELRERAVDVVGTGGDQAHTVNISTMAALVAAGAGVPVVKHGNRAASSSCGAADLLEHLGIPLDLPATAVTECVRRAGIGFCFAPVFHSGLRHAAVARREMGVPTFFNFLGPLTNPGRPRSAAVGCADARMAPLLAAVFAERGDTVLVMRGEDGLDEFTTSAPTRLWVAADGGVRATVIDAAELGVPRSAPGDLRGADAEFNGGVARRLLAGEGGPVREAVVLNAAAALLANAAHADPALVATDDALATGLRDGMARAAAAIDSGAASATLDRWVDVAAELKAEIPPSA
ncbi:MAG TPA: anthranilate phosphoribosyltransferase [Micromonosporaceae bacterium]|nr:anthranilate phosphoribosyltransferase [Micromonosporaceae bacterium]